MALFKLKNLAEFNKIKLILNRFLNYIIYNKYIWYKSKGSTRILTIVEQILRFLGQIRWSTRIWTPDLFNKGRNRNKYREYSGVENLNHSIVNTKNNICRL